MKKKTILTILLIVTVLLSLWLRNFFKDNKFQLPATVFLLLLVLFVIASTWLLYRKDWCQILGLNTKGITFKIIIKALFVAMLINLIGSGVVGIAYRLIFKEVPLDLLGENYNPIVLVPFALLLAPLTEEFIFRGFIQGSWQKLYQGKKRTPVKLIITVTSLLFAITHFHFLFNISFKQFLFYAIPLFFLALYFGWLRNKYQSIIPSIFAHFGANSLFILLPLLMAAIISTLPSNNIFVEIKRQVELSQYKFDTTSYNFDPNNIEEWQKSFKKFAILERPRTDEIIKHLKGVSTCVNVFFTIDTCGNIYNVHVLAGTDSSYIKSYGYNFAEDAIKFIQSIPQCKPYIMDGNKVEIEMHECVPFH